jgi:putative serine protease PepD
MRQTSIRTILATALLSSALTLLFLRWDGAPIAPQPAAPARPDAALAAAAAKQPPLSAEEETNIRVYNKVSPGVVNITKTVVEYDFFFSPVAREGTGSGSILDLDGRVLTNYHVVESAQNLEVALPDRTKYRAKVIGVDKQNDLAVLQLNGAPRNRLHPIPLGSSDDLKVGQKVLAIGNPFRLQNTLTTGIVSSLGRRIQTESGDLVENVIQTDAAINPGNSGGPLLNTAGEMIGVNTSIFTTSPSGGNIGIGFAVPINTVRRVVADLIAHGKVIRPWLGVEGYGITPDLAEALDLPVEEGVLVAKVYRGSSADAADIRGASQVAILYNERILIGGDIITHIEGKPVSSMEEIRLALESRRPGETVKVTLYRDRRQMQRSLTLNEPPPQRSMRF